MRAVPSARDVNVLQSTLVYCMFLDEHVNHEPQTILYFQNKSASQYGELVFLKSVSLNLVSQPYFLKPYFFSVKCIYYGVSTRSATEGFRGGSSLTAVGLLLSIFWSKIQFYSLYFIVHLQVECFAVTFELHTVCITA